MPRCALVEAKEELLSFSLLFILCMLDSRPFSSTFASYAAVTEPQDWSRDSRLLAYRQRHQFGNAQNEAMMARHFRVPPANASRANGRTQRQLFDDYLWLTQLQQARCYETAFAQWRRQRSTAANTMGILYWQLNDIWPGARRARP